MNRAIYTHDCNECFYLGPYGLAEEGIAEDLWIHLQGDHYELIHRYGDDGPEYGCMITIHNQPAHPAAVYQEIFERAKRRGLIKDKFEE